MIDGMSVPLMIRDMPIPQSRDLDGAVPVMGEEEFRAFYERTARSLWAYLSRVSGDPQRADDYLQEAYYRFYRAGKQYETESHRRNSLFRIATNVLRDAARRRRIYGEVPLADEESPAMAPRSAAPSPERQAALRTDVARAIQQLEPLQRELLWLAYAQGVSHDEIAAILGLRSISIRTLLFRAKKKLAAILTGRTA